MKLYITVNEKIKFNVIKTFKTNAFAHANRQCAKKKRIKMLRNVKLYMNKRGLKVVEKLDPL